MRINMTEQLKYKRILLKISGEALQGDQGHGINPETLVSFAKEIKNVHSLGVEIAIVVGGGNIFRGINSKELGVDRVTGDQMGMLATIINAVALQNALENIGVDTRVQTAIAMQKVAEPYIIRRTLRHLQKGRVVILGGGTGNPFFTTDTTAALRANEIGAEVLMKATMVDGIYDKDPKKHSDAVKYETLDYMEAISKKLKVMDLTAVSLCMENSVPILVFKLTGHDNIAKAVRGDIIGTLVNTK